MGTKGCVTPPPRVKLRITCLQGRTTHGMPGEKAGGRMRGGWPWVRDLVFVGGGHAHALVLRRWAMDPQPGVRVTVINPGPVAPYTGMLPGHIAGHYPRAALMIDLVRLAEASGARLILGRAVALDPARRTVTVEGWGEVGYDVASLDIGIGSGLPDLPGFAEHAVAAKPLGDYADRWEAFLAAGPPDPHVTVIGAGVGGVELAMAMAFRLRGTGRTPHVTVIEAQAPLAGSTARAKAALLDHLRAAGVGLRAGVAPLRIGPGTVEMPDGPLRSDFTVSVAGARPQDWLASSGLALHRGFVTVGPTLQSSDPAVFAAGDCAHLSHAPRPKAGVFAVREAPVLHHNLRAALSGSARLRPYRPQAGYLKLVSLGDRAALAEKAGVVWQGRWVWWLKDRIDRAFMEKFAHLPAMPRPAPPPGAAAGLAEAMALRPMCAGCGAKVGSDTLSAALSALPPPRRADVVAGRGDDAAVLRAGDGRTVLTTDHLRAFTGDERLMARIAAVHALGDVCAMGAAPQAALAQVVLPRATPAIHAAALRTVMAGAAEVFAAAGADVVGGHSSVGEELTIGFTVTGTLDRPALTKAGARPGDALILTKPLGTGTIMAALMAQGSAPGVMLGEAVAGAFASMTRLPLPASRILASLAHAMTDVTGFGLAGHLLEMLDASGVAATLDHLPLLPGAEALAAAGHASSLAPANRAATLGRVVAPNIPRAALLWDPQTGGGLLAAVPADRANDVLQALAAEGEPAWRIGTLTAGPARITLTG